MSCGDSTGCLSQSSSPFTVRDSSVPLPILPQMHIQKNQYIQPGGAHRVPHRYPVPTQGGQFWGEACLSHWFLHPTGP